MNEDTAKIVAAIDRSTGVQKRKHVGEPMTRRGLLSGFVASRFLGGIVVAGAECGERLRAVLRKLGRFCEHAECWDAALQNIRDGADHITYGPCCHDYKHNKTYYRVIAEWLEVGEYGVEGRRRKLT